MLRLDEDVRPGNSGRLGASRHFFGLDRLYGSIEAAGEEKLPRIPSR
jgi:hypothetical protein